MRTMEFSDITKEDLAEAFELAAIECEIDDEDNELYLKKSCVDFPLWVQINDERKTIMLYTHLKFKDDAPRDQLAAFAQMLNDTYTTVQFATGESDDGKAFLKGYYNIYTNFGIIVPQLIHTVKKFSEIFIDAIREKDQEYIFFGS
ncbi:YbjN domain-containing protein [Chlorobium phaeovibrioides]|uniref:YbjN domain-containing protein n=2 Tax=Chlorobium phaeovibrioides TaxID=1094 RepID=A0ABW9UUF0_CHLPH|nr:YbjN domain-containing protein [Chlorobium phaeovibrioides]NQU46934.1 hypothetical protein [Chlorobium sp.]MDT9547624.1 hypothetical protein [Chlorobium phaeovibrioides]MWV55091.1 hypothetical protein [Chlorobium phaeovibrioides]QEQ57691.1 hypothetical protein FNV82_09350 [Chlorobium phaeovibrioides]HCD36757.1 hypothetical protein [Chlorobium sp.]